MRLASERRGRDACVPVATSGGLRLIDPTIAKAWIVLDTIKGIVHVAEYLPYPLDERSDIHTVAVLAIAGDEILPPDQIVDLPVGNVGVLCRRQQMDDLEFGQREIDTLAAIKGALDVIAQLQSAAREDRCWR